MKMKLIKRADIILIAVTVAVISLFYLILDNKTETNIAEVSVDGNTVYSVDLSSVKERTEIRPDCGYDILIVAENGTIRFEHSDCEDKLCVNSGTLRNGGDIAVCLPAKTVITVHGSEVDAVVY